MTNLEAVGATVGFNSPDPNIALKACTDVDLTPTDVYAKANRDKVDQASIAVLTALKILAKIDEGGFGVTFNTASADKTITFLYKRSGSVGPDPSEDDGGDTVTDISNLW